MSQATSRALWGRLLLAVMVGCPAFAHAAGLTISPVVIEVASPRKAVAITITNGSDRPVTLQADAMTWRQVDGVDRYEQTDELLVVPPLINVPANGSQLVRVTMRSAVPSPMERTYRLMLEDVSQDRPSTEGASVAFKFNHNLAVLVAPSTKIVTAVRWKACPAQVASPPPTNQACVRLMNSGNRRVKVQTVTVLGDGWQQALTLKDGVNVLAGAQREWRIPLMLSQTGLLRSLQAQTMDGVVLPVEAGGF